MLPIRMGIAIATHLWRTPTGALLAFFWVLSAPLLGVLSPHGHIAAEPSGQADLLRMAVLTGIALGLAGLGRREAFLERLPVAARTVLMGTTLFTSALAALLLAAIGAVGFAHGDVALLPPTIAAVHLSGLAIPLLAIPMHGVTRLAGFLACTWWIPALLLVPHGWQAHALRILAPAGASDSGGPSTMLPLALLACAVALGGALTARTLTRIR